MVLQGRHENSKGSLVSRFPNGKGFGSVRGNSRSISGMLNSLDSKRIHDKLQSTVGKALGGSGSSKNNLISQALRRISKISDLHSMPGLPVGTLSGRELPTNHHKSTAATKSRHMINSGRRMAFPGGMSMRTRSRALGKHRSWQRHRGANVITSRKAHRNQNGGVSMARRTSHRSSGSKDVHFKRSHPGVNSLQLSKLANGGHGHLRSRASRKGIRSSLDVPGHGSARISKFSSNSVGQGASDAQLIASLLDQGSGFSQGIASLLPNFVATEPKIFLDKQVPAQNAYPQIVVGRPEPLLAAPILPLALGSDGHVLTSSNTQVKQVLKSVLNTLSSSKSLSQQGIGALLQSIRNVVERQKKLSASGFKGAKIELSPIIHAGSKAVSTENIIKIQEPGSVSPIVLKTGGQLEISSGVNGNPTFKIYGFDPSTGRSYRDDTESDDEKKMRKKH